MLFFDPFLTLNCVILDKYILVRTDNLEANMNFIDRLVIAKIHPGKPSRSIPGSFYNEVELLDPNDNFKWYHTYIDDSNNNYAQWQQIFELDHKGKCFVADGMFRKSGKANKLINADAKFRIEEVYEADELLPVIAENLGLIDN